MNITLNRAKPRLLLLTASFLFSSFVQGDGLNKAEASINQADKQGQLSQKRIDALDKNTQDMLNEYRQLKSEVEQLSLYNRQMQKIVDSQNEELASLDEQLSEIERTERGILPLMLRMTDSLEQFVQADVPFLNNERTKRVMQLKALLQQADTTVSEKFRRVLEAYQIEVDYGRNIEAYREEQDNKLYDFLRIGRVGLFRLNQDKTQAWAWLNESQKWQALESSYLANLKKAYKVARQVSAPELLILPMPTKASAQGEKS